MLVVGFATPATAAPKYTVYQKTLASFSSTATSLTSQQRAQVKQAVEANPDAEKFICTGIRYVSQPMSEYIKVRARAKAACEYAKLLNPSLSTWFQNKPTNARSYAGKVLLTIKTPDDPQALAEELCPTVNLTDSNTELCTIANEKVETTAFSKLQARLDAAVASSVQANLFLSESMEGERARFARETQTALNFHGPDFRASEIQVMIFTPKEIEWARSKWTEISRSTLGNLFTIEQVQGSYCGPNNMRIGGQAVARESGDQMRYHFVMCFASLEDSKGSAEFLTHEFTHLVQSSQYQRTFYGFPDVKLPVWLSEGGATYTSALALSMEENRKVVARGFRPDFVRPILDNDNAYTVSLFKQLETTENVASEAWKSYFLGGLASELMVAVFGYEKFAQFQALFATNSSVSQNFETAFGVPIADFYIRAAEYVRYVIESRWRK